MTQAVDIAIVGAGMVGAALATGLGQAGLTVAVIDRAPAPAFDPDATSWDERFEQSAAGQNITAKSSFARTRNLKH